MANNTNNYVTRKIVLENWLLWYITTCQKTIMLRIEKNIFYNRSTNSAAFCDIQWISSLFLIQIINHFLNSRNSANHDKGKGF